MKVTIAFGETKIVVPCGSGDFSIKELASKAVYRMKHSLKFSSDFDRVFIHSLSISRDGGILDWDDLVSDVLDDREQLIAQYSIEPNLPEPAFSSTSFLPTPTPAPLVFDISRIHHSHADQDLNTSSSGLLGQAHVGHGNIADSSSSSLSLSSGSLGGGAGVIGSTIHHQHQQCRLPQNPQEQYSVSSRYPRAAGLPDPSLVHHQPLNGIGVPPTGLNEDQNKADSGYKSDHTRLFCDIPLRAAGRQTLVTPPLPPPIVFDYDKNPVSSALTQQVTMTAPISSIAFEASTSDPRFNMPIPATEKPVMDQLFEVLSRRRARLRSNWDYERNDYMEDGDEMGADDDEDDVDEDDFMEVSDAISGKGAAFVANSTTLPTTSVVEISTTTSSSGKRSTATVGTDGEGGNFSDEGLSTVRRVVQQPKEANFPLCPDILPQPSLTNIQMGDASFTSKGVEPLISFAETAQTRPQSSDRKSLSPLHQFSLADHQRISTPPINPVPKSISEEREDEIRTDQCRLTCTQINVETNAGSSTSEAFCLSRKKTQTPGDEEETEAEEDYPMLRLDYRLKDGQEGGLVSRGPLESNSLQPFTATGDEGQMDEGPHRTIRLPHHGLTTPAVLQWLESTQAAVATEGEVISPFATPSSVISVSSSLAPTSLGGCEDEAISASQHDLVSRVIRRNVREASEDLRRGFFLAGYQSEPVNIRLTNTMPGENLGIQIKPIFTEPTEIIPFVGDIPLHPNSNGKCEAGLEVHAIMPNGRVAREGILSVGDRILTINGTSLIGVPFDKSRELFQKALKNPELVLQVLPYNGKTARFAHPVLNPSRSASPPSLPIRDVDTGMTASAATEKPSCGLVLTVDHSRKGKEATFSKPGPPPPPRRSPHTALSQQQVEHKVLKTVPVLPPRHDRESAQPRPIGRDWETKIVRLRKGASGLGFSLTSRDQQQRKQKCPVFIKNILPGGAALLDGNLKPGDRLLMVDDEDVSELGQTSTVALLREKPIGSLVTLVVSSGPQQQDQNNPLSAVDEKSHDEKIDSLNNKDSTGDLKYFAVDPALVELHTFEIPISGPSVNEYAEHADQKMSSRSLSVPSSLLASAFTLGVSVRVRPINADDCSSSILEAAVAATAPSPNIDGSDNKPLENCSKNAVFVRTVIPGGAAYKDGRLQVEDRLLAIDNRPLSCLSSANALSLLKSSISRITADKEPFVRLLVARRVRDIGAGETSLLHSSTKEALRNRLGVLNKSLKWKRSEGTNTGSLDSLLVDAANRLNSFVVSANVHQTVQNEVPQPSTSTSRTRQPPSAFDENQKTLYGKWHVNQLNHLRNYSSLETLTRPRLPLLGSQTPTESKEEPGEENLQLFHLQKEQTDVTKVHSTATSEATTGATAMSGLRSGQIYRCDSQGTVDTTTESDSTTLNDLSGRVFDEDQLSNSSGYELLAVDASCCCEDERPAGGAVSEPEMLPSWQRLGVRRHPRRRALATGLTVRYRRSCRGHRRQRTVVVVKQPRIDLDKMVVVAFDKLKAGGGLQESVAVQTSPLEEDQNSKESNELQLRDTTGFGTGFWKKGKTVLDNGSEKQNEDQQGRRRHHSENALKRLLRFVKPSGRSNSECAAPAARIFSGRTLDRGTVAYTSTHHPGLRLTMQEPLCPTLMSTPPSAAGPLNQEISGLPVYRAHIVGDRPRALLHHSWNPSDPTLMYANSAPIQTFRASLSQGNNRLLPGPVSLQPDPSVTSSLMGSGAPPNEGNYVSLGRQNYAELAFSPALKQQKQHTMRLIPGSADSTLAHIPPPMATLSLTKLKSVLSSCPPQQPPSEEFEKSTPQAGISGSGSTNKINKCIINQLYDMNLSCCSATYETIVDVRDVKAGENSDPTAAKNDRKVYEDAEALYRHLSHVRVFDDTLSMPTHSPSALPNPISSLSRPNAGASSS